MSNFKYNETTINFGGFYESWHGEQINDSIDRFIEDYNEENNTELEYDEFNFDYSEIENQYINQYCNLLENYILNEYNLDIEFSDLKIDSPKFYNYSTDRIDCKINKPSTLMDYFKTDKDFLEYLKESVKSYDGYISYYDYNEALNNKNNILSIYILEYICNKFNTEKQPFFDIYIDIEYKINTKELVN